MKESGWCDDGKESRVSCEFSKSVRFKFIFKFKNIQGLSIDCWNNIFDVDSCVMILLENYLDLISLSLRQLRAWRGGGQSGMCSRGRRRQEGEDTASCFGPSNYPKWVVIFVDSLL